MDRLQKSKLAHAAAMNGIEKKGNMMIAEAQAKGGARKPVAPKKAPLVKKSKRATAVKKGGDLYSAMDKVPEAAKEIIKLTNANSRPGMSYVHEYSRTPAPGNSRLVKDCASYMLSKLTNKDIDSMLERAYTDEDEEDPWTKEEFRAIPKDQLEQLREDFRGDLLIDFQAECLRQRRAGELTHESYDKMVAADSKKKSRKSRAP